MMNYDRSLLRAASSIIRVSHPAARYVGGNLTCAVCNGRRVENALWGSHLASSAHKQNLQELSKNLKSGDGNRGMEEIKVQLQTVESAFIGASVGAISLSVPEDFYEKKAQDRKEKEDKEAELQSFIAWTGSINAQGETELQAEELRYQERSEEAVVESEFYKVRLEVLKDLVREGRLTGSSKITDKGEAALAEEEKEGGDEIRNSIALVVESEKGVSAAELCALMKRPRGDGKIDSDNEASSCAHDSSESDEDILNWRKKRGK